MCVSSSLVEELRTLAANLGSSGTGDEVLDSLMRLNNVLGFIPEIHIAALPMANRVTNSVTSSAHDVTL